MAGNQGTGSSIVMERCLIVARAANGAIGRDNQLLWHIREDLKFFKATTMGCPVIMGRKTFESIGRALPGRLNIVISRGKPEVPEGVVVVGSIEAAYAAAEASGAERCFITGGGRIYAEAIDTVERMFVTEVEVDIPDADTFFPTIDTCLWTIVSETERRTDPENGYVFRFVEYVRNLTDKCSEKVSAAGSEPLS